MDEKKIIKDIDAKIKRLKRSEIKDMHDLENLKDAFYNKLWFYDYTKDKKKRKKILKEAKDLAAKIPELKDWPYDKKTFWDTESYGWTNKIPKEVRQDISKEFQKKIKKDNILSLGSGSYPYTKDPVLVDISEKMLDSAPKKSKKFICDLDKQDLPFKDDNFDHITMAFILDYLKDPLKAIKEAKRVLKKDGSILIVQSKEPVDDLYSLHIKEHISKKDIKRLFNDFHLNISEKNIKGKILLFAEAKICEGWDSNPRTH